MKINVLCTFYRCGDGKEKVVRRKAFSNIWYMTNASNKKKKCLENVFILRSKIFMESKLY